MALTVETGAGLADADSYVSVAGFKAYCDMQGLDYAGMTDEAIEIALRRATQWIDVTYGPIFKGTWRLTTQALEWPRVDVVYRDRVLPYDEIPAKLGAATCEAAFREAGTTGTLFPDTVPVAVKRDRVGDVETEFRAGAVQAGIGPISVIDGYLADLTLGRASAYFGRSERA